MRIFGAAFGLLLAAGMSPVSAASFEGLFVFGDSLSDTGRVYEITKGAIPPSPPYFDGRFSNGPVWVERLAPLVGTQASQNTNYAYGGAETGVLSQIGVPGVRGQVGQFALSGPGGRDGALFAVWAGGNDYLNRLGAAGDPAALVQQTVGNIVTAVEQLVALGGRTFVVPNLPNLGEVPDTRGTPAAPPLNAASALHNTRLQQAMADVEQRLGVTVVVADINALYRAVGTNPAAYGFTNWTTPCISDDKPTGACATEAAADATLYWDELHPTRAAHLLIAQYVAGTLAALNDAAETVAVQPELAFELARGWHRAVLGSPIPLGTSPGTGQRAAGNGPLSAFIIGDAAWGRRGDTVEREGFRYDAQVGGVGAELAIGAASRIGLSLGFAHGNADLDRDSGDVDMTSTIVGLHAVTEAGGFRLGAVASVGFDRYGDIRRATRFATLPTASAETSGHTYAFTVEGAYTAWFGGVAVEPRLALRHIHAEVDSYAESGAGPLNLGVDRQSARSLESSVGVAASTTLILGSARVEPQALIAWEHEFSGGDRTVTVHLPGGGFNRITPGGDARDALVLGAGLSAGIGDAVTAIFGYRAELAGAGGHDHAFSARVRVRF